MKRETLRLALESMSEKTEWIPASRARIASTWPRTATAFTPVELGKKRRRLDLVRFNCYKPFEIMINSWLIGGNGNQHSARVVDNLSDQSLGFLLIHHPSKVEISKEKQTESQKQNPTCSSSVD